MANAFNKEILRSITRSAGRFVAILIISLLGAGFYAGLRMAAPDMRINGDSFFDGTYLYDLSVITELGLDDESLDLLRGVEGVGAVMPTYRADAMARVHEDSYAARVESIPLESAQNSDTSDGINAYSDDDDYLNRPILVQGQWPSNASECVVGVDAALELGIDLGDAIEAVEDVNGDDDPLLTQTTFKVVGFVNSPVYASSSTLGPTSLGTGTLELYLFVSEEAFDEDLPYSIAYLYIPAARPCLWDSAAYDQEVETVKQRVEELSDELATARQQAVKDALHFQVLGIVQEMSADLGWADDIEKPEVYLLDRSKNTGVASLSSDAEGITQIALFLPFMFFLVAALVSLTSMTRMVEEERLDIGTHKALGYGKRRIMSKYLVYGALASGVGSVVGVVVMGKLLPWFILVSYDINYAIPSFATPLDPFITFKAVGLSLLITVGATLWAGVSTLRERPAALMLPRVPKAGKRIILERIGFVWERLSFSQKVTARNLLRYKRRFFMAVLGVAGCTALLMIGFGLRDAIGGIVSMQYEDLIGYDVAVRLDDKIKRNDRELLLRTLDDSEDVEACLEAADFSMLAEAAKEEVRIEVVVPRDASRLGEFVTLRDRVEKTGLELEDAGIVLTEKAADLLGVSAGDTVVLFDENDVGDKVGEGHEFTVAGIAENYLGHYAYLLPHAYELAFEEEPTYDMVYVTLAEGAGAGEDSEGAGDGKSGAASTLASSLLDIDGVNTVSFMSDKILTYQNMLDVMNKLIFVIVLLSATLAFVVLYNLTNINITERVREIATIKVLGFTRNEVSAYIFREVGAMAIIGALIGCVLGVPLTFYIARAAETANMMFGRTIEPISFALSFALTLVFTFIVAFTMRPKLAHVNMVESLKSVE